MGQLRDELRRSNGFDLKEVAKDYSKLSTLELHEQLAGQLMAYANKGDPAISARLPRAY